MLTSLRLALMIEYFLVMNSKMCKGEHTLKSRNNYLHDRKSELLISLKDIQVLLISLQAKFVLLMNLILYSGELGLYNDRVQNYPPFYFVHYSTLLPWDKNRILGHECDLN